MGTNPYQPQNQHIVQCVRRIKLRDYSDPSKSQIYTKTSTPLDDNVSFRTDPHNYYLPSIKYLMKSPTSFLRNLPIFS